MRRRAKKLAWYLSGRAPNIDGHIGHYWSMCTDKQVHSSRTHTNCPGDILVFSGVVSQSLPLHESSILRMMYVYEQADSFVHVYHTTHRSLMDGVYVFGATFDTTTDPNIPYIGACGQNQRTGTVRFHYHKLARANDNLGVFHTFFDPNSTYQRNRLSCERFQQRCRRYVETGTFNPTIDTELRSDIDSRVNRVKTL